MADATADERGASRRSRLLPIALVAALILGGGSFYVVWSGMVPIPWEEETSRPEAGEGEATSVLDRPPGPDAGAPPAFVELDPLLISLGPESTARHLKVRLTLDVVPGRLEAVEATRPRIADVLNTFLRAVEPGDLADPRRMMRLRAQMLRRVQLVTPQGSVRDLLIQEFVLN